MKPATFADATFGVPTITDILAELEKPGRDPRPAFKTATFKDGVEKVADLKPGMRLEGVVTNVTAFGAFVDVGVHQDGLVHISELSDTFVKDPHDVVKAGDVVSVRVKEVDVARNRIGLSMKSSDGPSKNAGDARGGRNDSRNDSRGGGGKPGGPSKGARAGAAERNCPQPVCAARQSETRLIDPTITLIRSS